MNSLEVNNLASHMRTKNIRFLVVKFDDKPPEDWIYKSHLHGALQSAIIHDIVWHQFDHWITALNFTLEFQGTITPQGPIDIFLVEIPVNVSLQEVLETFLRVRLTESECKKI